MTKPEGVTVADLARTYGRDPQTVRLWTRTEAFRAEVSKLGKRGNSVVYDSREADAVIRRHWVPDAPEVDGSDDDHMTLAEIARYTNLRTETLTSYRARGQWPEADGYYEDGTPYWFRSTVEELRRMSKRRRAGELAVAVGFALNEFGDFVDDRETV